MSAQRSFTISTPMPNVRAESGNAAVVYTVANTSGLPARGLARIVPLGDTRAEWLALAGQNEREFPVDGIHQFTVAANLPADASGRYSLRLDVLSARKAGEESYAGPVVTIETTSSAAPARPSRWWLWAAALVLLLITGVVTALLLRSGDDRAEAPIAEATDTVTTTIAAATPTLEPAAKEVPVPDVVRSAMFVTDAIDWLQGAGFRVDLRTDSGSDAPRGTVVRQVPAAGATSVQGSIVRLTVADSTSVDLSLTDEEQRRIGDTARDRIDRAFAVVKVPDLRSDMTDFVDATLQLQRLNLKADLELPPDHLVVLARVYQQDPAGGAEVKSGGSVRLRVGAMGPGPYAVVVSKFDRLTPDNQKRVQNFLQQLETRRLAILAVSGR